MKKTTIAVPLLCALAFPAFADEAMSIYGVIDMALVREAGGKDGALTRLTSGVPMGSRLGFGGSEELGRGVKALFLLENGFQADTGEVGQGGTLFGRQAWVGLQGPFGSVLVGRQYTPQYATAVMADPFGSGYVADSKNLVATSGNAFSRMDNTVKYLSPFKAQGVTVELAAAPGEAGAAGGRQLGAALDWRAGALRLRLGHHDRDNGSAGANGRNTLLGANYDAGIVTLYAAFGRNRGLNSSVLRNTANPFGRARAPAASRDSVDRLIGLLLPFGPYALMASLIDKDDRGEADQDARQYALGLRYALSRRTELYAVHSRIVNRNGAGYTVGNASESGSGDRASSLGVRHSF